MKLLILTQKLDKSDPILGFFHRWVEEFSKHCDQVIVICLEKGEYNLPANVAVHSLGKEAGESRFKYIFNFYKLIFQERKNYETVFVHMNPEYVVLGGWLWRAWHKKIILWYTHKAVNLKLKLAAILAHKIFTASRSSFRLNNSKVLATGHGIDTEFFKPATRADNSIFNIVCVGRFSRIKNQLKLLEIFSRILPKIEKPIMLNFIGPALAVADKKYLQQAKDFAAVQHLENKVKFSGAVAPANLPIFYQAANLLVNLSQTGSLDKDVLEAAACGLAVLTSNEAYRAELPAECCAASDSQAFSAALLDKINNPRPADLRAYVMERHSLPKLINRIMAESKII